MMMFRILGPVRLYQQERVVDLGSAKVRGLLGILLLSANKAVRIDWIIERLWEGKKPPPDARRTLQAYASKLRSVLTRTHAPAKLFTEHGHYRLQVDPPTVDYHRFRALATQGQRAFRAGDCLTATAKLGAAVELWQGQPLADLRSSWARQLAESMARHDLLPVYYILVRAHLQLGNGESALELLRPMLAAHPTDVQLVELQMRALAEVNGTSSAVGYFHGIVEQLRQTLSIDPTNQLLRVYDELVAGAAASEPPRSVARNEPARRIIPCQLPRDIPYFIGRAEILAELDERLAADRTDVVVTLDGAPGVGKTALATYWAHRRRDRFPDGILYAELNGYGPGRPVRAATVLAMFLTAVGVSADTLPDDLRSRIALLGQQLAGRRMLVVLDNAFDSEHVMLLLAATAPCPVLITSRQKLSLREYHDLDNSITVPTLRHSESIAFLLRGIGDERAQQDMVALRDFADLCDGLPIALRIVAEHVAVRTDVPLAQLVVHLRRRQLLDAGSHGDRGSRTLRAVFDLSVDKFPSHVARFFGLLGVFPTPWITAEAAAVLTGLPLADAERMFDVLVGAHLVGQVSEGSYRLHDLLHLYAEEHARSHETPDVLADCVHRMVDWYLHSGINAMRTISPQEPAVPALSENTTVVPHEFADADDARRWFLAEQKNILGISMCAAKYHMHDHMWRLVGTFSELLNHYCDPNDIVDVHRQAVASARIDGARDGESGILNSLGAIEFQRGDYGSAARYFKQALTIFEEIDDQQGEAVSLLNIGNTYVKRGRWRSALPFHNRSLAIFESIGDQSGQARVHHWLGKAHQRDGQFEVAGDYFLRSLDVSTEIADEHGQTLALAELSELCLARGELVAAKDYCSKAVEIGAGIFDQKIVSGVLRTQAAVCLKLGDCEGAARSAAKAEVLCRSTNDLRGSADALEISARAYGLMGDRARAERSWVLALELYEKLGDAQADRVRDELRRFRTDDD